jgi:hypothetical protein
VRRARAERAARQAGAAAAVPQSDALEAVQRQPATMRELSSRAFPDVVPDDAPAPIEQTRVQRRRQVTATETAALRRARAEPSWAAHTAVLDGSHDVVHRNIPKSGPDLPPGTGPAWPHRHLNR